MTRVGVLTWDWREQPDIEALDRIVGQVCAGAVRIQRVDTGGQQYAVVVSPGGLTRTDVQRAYEAWESTGGGDLVEVPA